MPKEQSDKGPMQDQFDPVFTHKNVRFVRTQDLGCAGNDHENVYSNVNFHVLLHSLLAPQRYDAFVMYDVADKEFILSEFLPKVETAAGLKLFIPGRDSPAGDHHYDAQLEAMMTR